MQLKNCIYLCALTTNLTIYGFESTNVLPQGISNLTITNISSSFATKKGRQGQTLPLADSLNKPLKFNDILKSESGLTRTQIKALLLTEPNLNQFKSIGVFESEMAANINVTAPVFAYGISQQLTLAIGIPFYQANSKINVGFRPNANAKKFVSALADQETNSVNRAIETAHKINNAVARLNERLTSTGHRELKSWKQSGLGDITLAAKYLAYKADILRLSLTTGLVLPTGKPDDPDNLIDIPFGDNQTDFFLALTADQALGNQGDWIVNEYFRYTYQAKGRKKLRMTTGIETLDVEKKNIDFNLGDKLEMMTSIQYQSPSGLLGGIGGQLVRKFQDNFGAPNPLVKKTLEQDSGSEARYGLIRLGYSSVAAFRRKKFVAPLQIAMEYRHQAKGWNTPVTHFTHLDFKLFF